MTEFKGIQFGKGYKMTLTEFKKAFTPVLKKLNTEEVKQAHKAYNKENGDNIRPSNTSKEANENKN